MKRSTLVLIVVALLIAAGAYLLFFRDKGGAAAPRADAGAAASSSGDTLEPPPAGGQQVQPRFDADPEGPLRLEGQVLGADGGPVGGAMVTLSSNPPRTAETEDDGSFYFDKLIGRTYALTARSGDLAGGPVAHELTETSDPVVIRMREGGAVEVTVVAAGSGEPIAGAEVQLRAADLQTATSDSDGKARFRGVVSGWLVVAARAAGYGTATVPLMMPSTAGAKLTAELRLEPGYSIAGTVVDDSGAPIAGAQVTAESGELLSLVDPRYDGARTGDDGAFALTGVAGGKLRVIARHPEYADASTETLEVSSDLDGLKLVMDRGGVVAGRVISKAGEPVPWAQIVLRPAGTSNNWQAGGQPRGGRSDKDGTFEIKGLPRAKLDLVASSDEASSELVEVDLSERDRIEVEVVLAVTGSIAGRVIDAEGEPVAEVQVVLMPDWTSGIDARRFALRNVQTRTTDGGGSFRFTGLSDGQFVLRPTRDASNPAVYRAGGTKAKTGDTGVELVLLADGGVKGQVVSERGESVGGFTVTVGFPPGHPVADPRGEFELQGLRPGTYDLKIRGADFAEKTVADVEIEPGKTGDVGTIKVAIGRTLTGKVLAAGGSAVAGATVVVGKQLVGSSSSVTMSSQTSTDEMMGIRRAVTDSSGRYRIRGLGPAELVAAAEHPERGRSRPASVPAQLAVVSHDFRLVPTGTVTGVVKKGDAPLPKVGVVATPSEATTQLVAVQADDKGQFRFDKLAAGDYLISAVVSSGFDAKKVSARAQVTGGAEVAVELVLETGDVTLEARAVPAEGAKVDNVQLFLFAGAVSPATGKEVNEIFLGSEGTGGDMKFTEPNTTVSFKELVPGKKTLCAIPITGDMQDPQFMQRLQEHATLIKVYCDPVEVKASPAVQSLSITVPEMEPLPPPG